MNKIKLFAFLLLVLLIVPVPVLAVDSLAVQIFQPKSPTNIDNFKLEFTTLDINNSPITVKCYKKSPSEASFVQFDGDKILKVGGNSGSCAVSNSVLNSEGTYIFFVSANGVDSETVSVDYKSSTPGTPHSYSKNKTGTCEYTVKVTTNNDGGKTSRVVLYRSDSLSFTADGGSQVDNRNAGSDVVVEMKNSVPDCNKNYYFAVRAFDNVGNGSGIIGDENIVYTTSSSISNSVVVNSPINTNNRPVVVKDSSINPEGISPTATVDQEISITPTVIPEILGSETKDPFWKTIQFRIGVIVVLAGLFISQRKKGK